MRILLLLILYVYFVGPYNFVCVSIRLCVSRSFDLPAGFSELRDAGRSNQRGTADESRIRQQRRKTDPHNASRHSNTSFELALTAIPAMMALQRKLGTVRLILVLWIVA